MVTHDPRAARRCDRVLKLEKGRVADGAIMLADLA
jgi:predicted ABC-type transport system involved in lysophospholipase L1 biosynthesis ATPase subunit